MAAPRSAAASSSPPAKGDPAPVYCLHGPERYLIDRAIDELKRRVLGDGAGAGLNHDVFDLKESGLDRAVAAARTLPMFAKRRLVVGHGIDQTRTDEHETLIEYLRAPNPSTCLVLVGEKADGRLKLFQALKKAGALHEHPHPKERELPDLITAEAARRKATMDGDAALALANAIGADLGRLAQAVEQLALYAGEGARITRDHVESVVADTRERSVFDLTKAIAAGQVGAAAGVLANLLAGREPPLRIHFMLSRQLRQIWRAKQLLAAGADRGAIASGIGMSPYFLDEILEPARRLPEAALRRAHERLYRSDRALKSSRLDGDLQIGRLVREMAADLAGRP